MIELKVRDFIFLAVAAVAVGLSAGYVLGFLAF